MEKVHADNAAKQRAYRERLQTRRREGSAGYEDSELGQGARDLQISIEQAAQEGNALAELLRGETPLETLRNIAGHITRPPKVGPY